MNNSEVFSFELSLINNDLVKKLTIDILDTKVPDYINTLPSSSSKKYHPVDENGNVVTIATHTKSAVRILYVLLDHPMISGKMSDFEKDICISATILHDCVKYGIPPNTADHTVHEHPILVSLLYPYDDTNSEYYLIFEKIVEVASTHHGPWQRSVVSDLVLPPIETDSQWYVHLADYLSSRRWITIDTSDSEDVRASFR